MAGIWEREVDGGKRREERGRGGEFNGIGGKGAKNWS
jgi:hypothetical protein